MKEQVEKAFDYRGDVTVDYKDGSSIEGFIFNRSFEAKPDFPDGFVELIQPNDGETLQIGLDSVKAIRLTGKDFAAT